MNGLVALALLATFAPPVKPSSSVDRFQLDGPALPVHSVFHYLKSNQDGSRATRFSVYVLDESRLASLKHNPGGEEASYVIAEMDWDRFCATRIDSWRVRRSGQRQHLGTLRYDPAAAVIKLKMGERELPPIAVGHVPFHLWDFDFTSLNFTFRHLKDPHADFVIGVADPTYRDTGPPFLYKGEVDLVFVGTETRQGVACRKYRVNGAGLEHRGGAIWVDKARGHIVEVEIALPDEPGFDDVRIRLERIETLSEAAWDQFIVGTFVSESPR